ncbi:hypothetical protein [Agromyces humatus]|uniref:Uncharacterized protein n=1 Tax=Agromyces humatus TaxID=279573 RepID=A0ABP4X5U6_9MICO|nr:hypothetical protein [Agromyces humatus]
MPKIKTPKTKSQPNPDLAPLPERRRSTFREPAADVDLGLFGLAKGDPETAVTTDLADATDVVDVSAIAVASNVVDVSAIAGASDVAAAPLAAERPDTAELSAASDEPEPADEAGPADGPGPTEVPEAAPVEAAAGPSQQRARHRADRAGNRRPSGSSSFRIALPAP